MTTTHRKQLLAALGLGALCASCAGARANVTADSARYPIPLSPVVRDQSGKLLERGHLVKVGQLDASSTKFAVFYSLAATRTYDVSDDVNSQVAAAGGEAVVNFSVSAGDGCQWLNSFPLLNALPLWPGCVPVTISGDIVKRALPTTAAR